MNRVLGYLRRRIVREKTRRGSLMVVAAGSSTTAGYFETGRFDQLDAYPEHLRRLLIERNPGVVVNMVNAGVGGDTAPLLLSRLNRDVVKHAPDIVVVMIGLNDAFRNKPGFRERLDRITVKLRDTGAKVILATPGYLAKTPDYAAGKYADAAPKFNQRQNDGVVAEYAQIVRDVAKSRGVALADVYAMWEAWEREGIDTDTLLANGLNHPVPEVHKAMAELIANTVARE